MYLVRLTVSGPEHRIVDTCYAVKNGRSMSSTEYINQSDSFSPPGILWRHTSLNISLKRLCNAGLANIMIFFKPPLITIIIQLLLIRDLNQRQTGVWEALKTSTAMASMDLACLWDLIKSCSKHNQQTRLSLVVVQCMMSVECKIGRAHVWTPVTL